MDALCWQGNLTVIYIILFECGWHEMKRVNLLKYIVNLLRGHTLIKPNIFQTSKYKSSLKVKNVLKKQDTSGGQYLYQAFR